MSEPRPDIIYAYPQRSCRRSLSKQVKIALDETRLLMLGAQVLFGFKLNGVFQEEFANLSVASRYVDCAGQVLMAMAAPSMQHRIVENGEDTVRIHRNAMKRGGCEVWR